MALPQASVLALPDGTVLETVSNTPQTMFQTLQPIVATAIGLAAIPFFVLMTAGNPTIQFSPSFAQFLPPQIGGEYEYLIGLVIVGYGFAENTVIIAVSGSGVDLTLEVDIPPILNADGNPVAILYPNNPLIDTTVRFAWQKEGAPSWGIDEDTVSIELTQKDDDYDKVFNQEIIDFGNYNEVAVLRTAVWSVRFVCRGPNAYSNARALKTAFGYVDWVQAQLAASLFYPIPAIDAPIRSKELFEGQWWERWDLVVEMNEEVGDVYAQQTVTSVDITLESADTSEEFTVSVPD